MKHVEKRISRPRRAVPYDSTSKMYLYKEQKTASKDVPLERGKPIVTKSNVTCARREERNWIFAIGTAGTITQTCFSASDQGGRGKRERLRWRMCDVLLSTKLSAPRLPTHATLYAT